jgi:hypothetical protein
MDFRGKEILPGTLLFEVPTPNRWRAVAPA